ncbi:SRPBCC family protein [Streptomyces marispadix]|uniref:SRPBCC family protein n=1 Tax=Streptomyces marispadix TaxID=2922868 RepID=A0ABS9SSY3_9ACTN|nr:SRPBCC family protein [Streptomyces marispadix]MCH6159384.1 SRPBCC family protein [Streptomyces marispadix]
MSEHERSRTVAALPEEVFAQARDVGQIETWIPRELHVCSGEPPAVTVHDDETGRDSQALLRAHRDRLRLEWGTRGDGRYAGWLQVEGIGGGASAVTVHLSFFDERQAPPGSEVDAALDESLDRLAEQVRLRADRMGH